MIGSGLFKIRNSPLITKLVFRLCDVKRAPDHFFIKFSNDCEMGLKLAPATLSPPKPLQSTILLNKGQATVNTMKKMNEVKEFANLIGHKKFERIADEILLTAEASGQTSNHWEWEFDLSPTLGVLKVIEVKANLEKIENNLKIDLTAVFVEISQVIPQVYSTVTGSYKTGHRRYFIMGPKKRVDYCYQIPRGLNSSEIAQVIQALQSKIPEARDLIKAAWFPFKEDPEDQKGVKKLKIEK